MYHVRPDAHNCFISADVCREDLPVQWTVCEAKVNTNAGKSELGDIKGRDKTSLTTFRAY